MQPTPSSQRAPLAPTIEVKTTVPASLEGIAGTLAICITRIEVCAKESTRAADAAARTELAVDGMKASLKRIQSDHISLRHGIPASWVGRLAVVGFAAMIGALFATTAIACSQRAAGAAVVPFAPLGAR